MSFNKNITIENNKIIFSKNLSHCDISEEIKYIQNYLEVTCLDQITTIEFRDFNTIPEDLQINFFLPKKLILYNSNIIKTIGKNVLFTQIDCSQISNIETNSFLCGTDSSIGNIKALTDADINLQNVTIGKAELFCDVIKKKNLFFPSFFSFYYFNINFFTTFIVSFLILALSFFIPKISNLIISQPILIGALISTFLVFFLRLLLYHFTKLTHFKNKSTRIYFKKLIKIKNFLKSLSKIFWGILLSILQISVLNSFMNFSSTDILLNFIFIFIILMFFVVYYKKFFYNRLFFDFLKISILVNIFYFLIYLINSQWLFIIIRPVELKLISITINLLFLIILYFTTSDFFFQKNENEKKIILNGHIKILLLNINQPNIFNGKVTYFKNFFNIFATNKDVRLSILFNGEKVFNIKPKRTILNILNNGNFYINKNFLNNEHDLLKKNEQEFYLKLSKLREYSYLDGSLRSYCLEFMFKISNFFAIFFKFGKYELKFTIFLLIFFTLIGSFIIFTKDKMTISENYLHTQIIEQKFSSYCNNQNFCFNQNNGNQNIQVPNFYGEYIPLIYTLGLYLPFDTSQTKSYKPINNFTVYAEFFYHIIGLILWLMIFSSIKIFIEKKHDALEE